MAVNDHDDFVLVLNNKQKLDKKKEPVCLFFIFMPMSLFYRP